jgi:hypothetical protein
VNMRPSTCTRGLPRVPVALREFREASSVCNICGCDLLLVGEAPTCNKSTFHVYVNSPMRPSKCYVRGSSHVPENMHHSS